MKEQLKESYSFKPQISRNTDEILKNREKALEEVRSKYIKESSDEKKRRSNSLSSFPICIPINEVQNEDVETEPKPEEIDYGLNDYYKKLEKRLDE
jgi:hypothetical protein